MKLIRILIAMRDAHFEKYLIRKNLLEPILDLVIETMPRDNLLNSACLEFFEFIKRVNRAPSMYSKIITDMYLLGNSQIFHQ